MSKNKFALSKTKQYYFSTIVLFLFIIILYNLQRFIGYETVSLILLMILFLLPVFNFEKGPIILSSVVSALAWDYYFIPPHFTMHIARTEDAMMLFMFFIVAVTNGVLTSKLKKQKDVMTAKERRSEGLYKFIKDLSLSENPDEILSATVKNIAGIFGFQTVLYLPENENYLRREPHKSSTFLPDEMEWLAAETAFKSKSTAGKTTGIMHNAEAIYFPVISDDIVRFVAGININDNIKSGSGELNFIQDVLNEVVPFLSMHHHYSRP